MKQTSLIIDFQDLWSEGIHFHLKHKVLLLFFSLYRRYAVRAYRKADGIVAVSDTYLRYLEQFNPKAKEGLTVFLGKDSADFDEPLKSASAPSGTNPADGKDGLTLCYTGTMGYSYDLPCVIDAMAKIKNDPRLKKPVHLLAMGGGPLEQRFRDYAAEKAIDCEFTGMLPYKEMLLRLCRSDISVNPIVSGAPQSIINKVADYALAGLPCINTLQSDEYRRLLDTWHSGINCRTEDSDDVAEAIIRLANDDGLRRQMGAAARRMGEALFDRRRTYPKILERFIPDEARRVVVIANFQAYLDGGYNRRFVYLCKLLHDRGHDVELILSDFEHMTKKPRASLVNPYPFKVTFVHEPGYSGNMSPARMWSHYVWGRNVGRYLRTLPAKPDVVYCAIPSMTAVLKAARYVRSKR